MPINIYSKRNQLLIKIISVFGIFVFIFSNVFEAHNLMIFSEPKLRLISITGIILNAISTILFIIVIIFPTKFQFFGFVVLYYSIWIEVIEPVSGIPLFLFFLSATIFLARGLLYNHKKLRAIIFAVFFIGFLLLPLRSGADTFLKSLIQNLSFTLACGAILFFFSLIMQNTPVDKSLNIKDYEGLTKRDCEWLNAILNNEKYEAIAINYHMNLGSVKNRFMVIFDILEVGDKTGFLNKYSDYAINFL